jgi:hypothetical protein
VRADVEDLANLLAFLGSSHGPEALEFGIVQRQTAGNSIGQEVDGGQCTVVIVDVI